MRFKRVAVAVSGGVDSAVTALLLKSKGFDVTGIYMENWDNTDEKGYCSSTEDCEYASFLCDFLKIRFHKVNFEKHYWNEVFCDLLKDYENGLTPNPDILCNRKIKFNHLFDYAIKIMNVDAIATGHYARSNFGSYLENYKSNKVAKLLRAKDVKKDQVFFLSQIEQRALRKTMFPLGDLMKTDVKLIAIQSGLGKFARKKESMGICFIGSRKFQDFIEEYIENKPGNFVDVDTGKILGIHNGLHQWTLGQRSRISGQLMAYYIARKHVEQNIIQLVCGTDHPLMKSKLFFTSKIHWISQKPDEIINKEVFECEFKFQHAQDWVTCSIFECDRGFIVHLEETKRAITPGQYAVFSKNNECLGSARIVCSPISEFSLYYFDSSSHQLIHRNKK